MKVKFAWIIELKPEIEARLLAQAIAQSVSVENLLEMLIENYCVVSLNQQQSDRTIEAQALLLSEDAIARESIY